MGKLKSPALALIILEFMPFIQLGVNFYISIAFLLFCFSFFKSIKVSDEKLFAVMLLSCVLLLFKSLINSAETVGSREMLLPIRELICFLGLIFISNKIESEACDVDLLNNLILIYLLLTLVLILYQLYKIINGEYFGFPIKYFVVNQETLAGADEALFHQTRFRPPAFYGEPSYNAFVVLSLLTISLKTLKTFKGKIIYTLLALSIVSFSQSFAGIVAIIFIIFYWVLFEKSTGMKNGVTMIFAILFFGVLAGLYFGDEIYLRLTGSLAGKDESSNTRITEPLMLLIDVISSGSVFGVNFKYIEKFLGYSGLDNALLRMFIYYGVLMSVPLIFVFLHAKDGLLILYILLSMCFNGEFFSYDKVLIVGMVIGLSKAKFIKVTKNDRYSRSL